MGLTHVTVKVGNPGNGHRAEDVRCLVDSGAIYSLVPRAVLRRLGIKPHSTREFVLANGEVIKRRLATATFEYQGLRGDSMVIVGEPGDDALLGATTLEGFGLVLDPFRRELRPMQLPLKRTSRKGAAMRSFGFSAVLLALLALLSGRALAQEDASGGSAAPAAEEAAPAGDASSATPPDETAQKVAALKERYQALRAQKEALEAEIAELEGAAGKSAGSGDDEESDTAKGATKAGSKLGSKKGGTRMPSSGATPPKGAKVGAPPEEQIEKLEERLAKIDKELRAIEREAAQYGLGSAGLMKK